MNTTAGNIPKVTDLDSNPSRAMKDQGAPIEVQENVQIEAGNAVASLSDSTKKLNVTVPSEPAVKKSRIDSENENQYVASQKVTEDQAKNDAMTSFGDIEDCYPSEIQMVCRGSDIANDKIFSPYSDADVELYKEFTRDSPNLYTKLSDESLLLDCDNFVNFELDRDRIIVLNIKDAKENSNSILEQHAITNARSKDLPTCLF